jgi:putative membrane protein
MNSLLEILLRWSIGAAALYATAQVVKGVMVKRTLSTFVAVAVIALLNTLVRPILFILTLPFTVLTLGLFLFILNGCMFLLAAKIVDGFEVQGFWDAVFGAFVYSVLSFLLLMFLSPTVILFNTL